MKNERRNAQTKATHQNTEPVWDAAGRTQRHPLDEYQHSLWAGQKNQDRPQRKRRRDPASAHRKGRRPARDVLGQASPADEVEKVIGITFSPDGSGKFVTNNKAWTGDKPARSFWTATWFFDKWRAWSRGEVTLLENFPGHRELVPTDPPVARCPARAPQVS